jgi:hypothetical protein
VVVVGFCGVALVVIAAGGSMVVVVVVVAMLRARHGFCCWTRCERRKPLNSCFAGAHVRVEAMIPVRWRSVGVV